MATKTLLRTVFLTEPWPRPSPCNRRTSFSLPSSMTTRRNSPISIPSGCGISRARDFHFVRRTTNPLNCSHNDTPPPPPSSSSADDHDQGPPQEAVLKAISEVSKAEGRVGQTTNLVIGGTVTDDSTNEWLVLDQKVNSYPTVRGFTAIGSGGDDFVQSMVVAVESVLQQPIPEGQVKHRESSRGNFVSVKIGPVRVISGEQVQAVYNAMRRDDRMKFFL